MLESRRGFLRAGAMLAGAAICTRPGFADAPSTYVLKAREAAGQAKLEAMDLPGGMKMVTGMGAGNVLVLPDADAGTLLVDAGFSTTADQMRAYLQTLGAEKVQMLVNTHWHFDHTDGNCAMHRAGAKIVAHRNTARWLATGHLLDIDKVMKVNFLPVENDGVPAESFRTKMEMDWAKEHITLQYHPAAHTDGDVAVHFANANVLHVGDLYSNGIYPMIDSTTGGSVAGIVAAGRMLMKQADQKTVIVPGHGPISKEPGLEAFVDMVELTGHRVREGKRSGHTIVEVIASKPTRDYDAKWGKGHFTGDQFAAILYAAV